MSEVDDILELIDAGLQRTTEESYGTDVRPDACARCQRNSPAGGELCSGCRAFLLGDSDDDPRRPRSTGIGIAYRTMYLGQADVRPLEWRVEPLVPRYMRFTLQWHYDRGLEAQVYCRDCGAEIGCQLARGAQGIQVLVDEHECGQVAGGHARAAAGA